MTQDPQKTKQGRGVHATLAGEVLVVVSGWWTIDIVMAADGPGSENNWWEASPGPRTAALHTRPEQISN